MKCLRFLVFLMAVGGLPALLSVAHGQQEVDPDHFDQAAGKAIPAPKANASSAAASVHSHPRQTRLASKHTGVRVHHRRAHPSV